MANLQIVIDAINNSGTTLDGLKTDIEEVGTAGDTAGEGVDTFDDSLGNLIGIAGAVAGAIATVIGAMEEVYETAKRGASINTTAAQFDNLATSIGINATGAMNTMRTASEGMITDLDLASAGTAALSLGVVDSAEGLGRLAKVSADLGIPMAKVVDMVNGVSPAGFERAGISMAGFKEQVQGLMDANDGWTKSQAETEAGLQRLETQVTKVGSATDMQTAAFVKNEVAQQNIKDIAAQTTAMNAGPVVGAINSVTQATMANQRATLDGATALAELKAAEDAGIITREQYTTATRQLGIHSGKLQGNAEGLTSATKLLDDAYARTGTTFDAVTGKVVEATNAVTTLDGTPLADKEVEVTAEGIDDAEAELKKLDELDLKDKSLNVDVTVSGSGAGLVTGGGGGGGGGTAYYQAVGGAVYGGNPYTWQEYGYKGELFVPSSNGFVMSRADAERALAKALTGGGANLDPDAIGRAVAKALSGVTKGNQSGNVYNLTMPTSSNPADVRTAFELMEAWA
jgi:hypothetical protein